MLDFSAPIRRSGPGLLLVLLTGLTTPLAGSDLELRVGRLKEQLAYLASDELQGRGVGTAGLDRAADFLANEFARLGLETQSQSFEMVAGAELGAAQANYLTLQGPAGADGQPVRIELKPATDFNPLAVGGNRWFSLVMASRTPMPSTTTTA
jgi:hypothetical protein